MSESRVPGDTRGHPGAPASAGRRVGGLAGRRILVALDVDERERALTLARELRDEVGGFKIGMRLFFRHGPRIVEELAAADARLFLDLKLHDIPETVAQGVRALAGLGAHIINVHAAGGLAMMRAAAEAAHAEAAQAGVPVPKLVAVTVLTSLEQENLSRELGFGKNLEQVVLAWAGLAKAAGLDGVVSSPLELTTLRTALGPDFLLITPGIRPAGAELQDQKRVLTPAQAVQAGADYLVIGRPITAAPDPVAAVQAIARELAAV
ncbi:MAG: orotidine-5'-phosphate decarboxylase [Bacillota bacterium]